jgi:hypothetical protein
MPLSYGLVIFTPSFDSGLPLQPTCPRTDQRTSAHNHFRHLPQNDLPNVEPPARWPG